MAQAQNIATLRARGVTLTTDCPQATAISASRRGYRCRFSPPRAPILGVPSVTLSRVRVEVDLYQVAIRVGAEVVGEWFRDERPHDRDMISLHAIVEFAACGV
jgi:hypothetical protein